MRQRSREIGLSPSQLRKLRLKKGGRNVRWFCTIWLICIFALVGCDDIVSSGLSLIATPTPNATPTPLTNLLELSAPNTRIILAQNEATQNAKVVYLGRTESRYSVQIDQQLNEKRVGDSVIWDSFIAPGVSAEYEMRIADNGDSDDLALGGTVDLLVFNPRPNPALNADIFPTDLSYEADIDYVVPMGQMVPGTTWRYVGLDANGRIQFEGERGVTLYTQGDGLFWRGWINPAVFGDYELTIIQANADQVRVTGVADIIIFPK